jgi:hypothetical protein
VRGFKTRRGATINYAGAADGVGAPTVLFD